MKNLKKTLFIILLLITIKGFSQSSYNYIDVVHLKNGNIYKGIIVEQIPNKSIKIRTSDSTEYLLLSSNIVKFSKELATQKTKKKGKLNWMNNFKKKDNGYFLEMDVHLNSYGNGFRITNGYKFNQFAYLGLALGLEDPGRKPYDIDNTLEYGSSMFRFDQLPLATINLVFSGDILNTRFTPYYQTELGYGIALERKISFQAEHGLLKFRNWGGPMFAISTGVKFKTKKKIVYKLGVHFKLNSNYSENEFHYSESENSPIKTGIDKGFNLNPNLGVRFGIGF